MRSEELPIGTDNDLAPLRYVAIGCAVPGLVRQLAHERRRPGYEFPPKPYLF